MSEPSVEEPAPAPVFVDQSGLRGRLLRGLGWPVSVVGAILAVAMGSSLVGMQADAPAMGIPVQPSSAAPSPSPTRPASPSAAPPASPTPSARTSGRSTTPAPKTSASPGASAKSTAPRGAAPSATSAKH